MSTSLVCNTFWSHPSKGISNGKMKTLTAQSFATQPFDFGILQVKPHHQYLVAKQTCSWLIWEGHTLSLSLPLWPTKTFWHTLLWQWLILEYKLQDEWQELKLWLLPLLTSCNCVIFPQGCPSHKLCAVWSFSSARINDNLIPSQVGSVLNPHAPGCT